MCFSRLETMKHIELLILIAALVGIKIQKIIKPSEINKNIIVILF